MRLEQTPDVLPAVVKPLVDMLTAKSQVEMEELGEACNVQIM